MAFFLLKQKGPRVTGTSILVFKLTPNNNMFEMCTFQIDFWIKVRKEYTNYLNN